MKLSLSGIGKIFNAEHRGYTVAALILLLAFVSAFILSSYRGIPYTAIDSYIAYGDASSAISLGEPYLKKYPDDARLIKSLAAAYLSKAESANTSAWVRRSRIILTRSHIEKVNDPEVMRLIGYGFFLIKNYDSSEGAYQKAASLSPKSALIWASMAELKQVRGDFGGADALYDKALSYDKDNTKAVLGKISTDLSKARFTEAIDRASLHLFVTQNPLVKAKLYESIGIALLRQNKVTSAADSFELALNINPDLPNTLANYSALLLRNLSAEQVNLTERVKQPLTYASKAYKLDPKNPYALASLSDVAYLRGDTSAAKKYASLLVAVIPSSNLSPGEKSMLSKKYSARVKGDNAVNTTVSAR